MEFFWSFSLFFKNTIKNTKNFLKLFVIFQKYLHTYAQTHINKEEICKKREKERKIHTKVGSVQKSIYGIKKYEGYITVDIKDLAINLEITLEGFYIFTMILSKKS